MHLALGVLVLAGVAAGIFLLIRSPAWGLRALGWTLTVVVMLFGGLILLTQGSAVGPSDYPFFGPQDKFPNGGLEVGGQGPVGYSLTA
jgi:hypothetical protein